MPTGWVAEDDFLAGYGAAQAVPGPLFTFAGFLGAVQIPEPDGIPGGTLALVALFLPAMLLLVGVFPFWDALRTRRGALSAFAGVNAAVVGRPAGGALRPGRQGGADRRDDDRDRGRRPRAAVRAARAAGGRGGLRNGDRRTVRVGTPFSVAPLLPIAHWMSLARARALPLQLDGVNTIAASCEVVLLSEPHAGQPLPVEAPAGALPVTTAFAIRFAGDDGQPRRALCVVEAVHPGPDGRERCTLRLVASPAPATGRAHPRTPAVVELMTRRVESQGQRTPIMIVDVAPGGIGFASFIELRVGEFLALDDLFGHETRILAQVVRMERRGEMWGYGAAFGNLEAAHGLVESLLAAAARARGVAPATAPASPPPACRPARVAQQAEQAVGDAPDDVRLRHARVVQERLDGVGQLRHAHHVGPQTLQRRPPGGGQLVGQDGLDGLGHVRDVGRDADAQRVGVQDRQRPEQPAGHERVEADLLHVSRRAVSSGSRSTGDGRPPGSPTCPLQGSPARTARRTSRTCTSPCLLAQADHHRRVGVGGHRVRCTVEAALDLAEGREHRGTVARGTGATRLRGEPGRARAFATPPQCGARRGARLGRRR